MENINVQCAHFVSLSHTMTHLFVPHDLYHSWILIVIENVDLKLMNFMVIYIEQFTYVFDKMFLFYWR